MEGAKKTRKWPLIVLGAVLAAAVVFAVLVQTGAVSLDDLKARIQGDLQSMAEKGEAAAQAAGGSAAAGASGEGASQTQPEPPPEGQEPATEATETPDPADAQPAIIVPEVGGLFSFGAWRDKAIVWIVLDKSGDKAFVLSLYSLAAKASDEKAGGDWAASTLRTWLNGDFLQTAFSQTEQQVIVPSDDDHLFLLGETEAAHYFAEDANRVAEFEWTSADTDEANRINNELYDGEAAVLTNLISKHEAAPGLLADNWLLWSRAAAETPSELAVVGADGAIIPDDGTAGLYFEPVRPAMWVRVLTDEAAAAGGTDNTGGIVIEAGTGEDATVTNGDEAAISAQAAIACVQQYRANLGISDDRVTYHVGNAIAAADGTRRYWISVTQDQGDHVATLGEYYVDAQTGEVTLKP
ncbi:MAG: DUF6273 domain-containing protein [Clostridiales Family XIII bacterium]|jgi:hypothetical protein|nr:DUF6273 domain-containing protein [Clostridiales Family XIII bacterium]